MFYPLIPHLREFILLLTLFLLAYGLLFYTFFISNQQGNVASTLFVVHPVKLLCKGISDDSGEKILASYHLLLLDHYFLPPSPIPCAFFTSLWPEIGVQLVLRRTDLKGHHTIKQSEKPRYFHILEFICCYL